MLRYGYRFLLFLFLFVLNPILASSQGTDSNDTVSASVADTSRIINITGVGDIMLGTAFPSKRYLPPGDNPEPLMSSVFKYLDNSDILFGNIEGPFTDNAKLAKRCKDTTKCYAFRMPEHYVSTLNNAGFNLISLANNHIGDFGLEGRNRTIEIFDSLEIKYAGPEDFPFSIFDKDSVRYGFAAFSPNKGTVNISDIRRATSIVSMLEDSCDIVIVSFHGGAEGASHQHVLREEESFYGENRGNVYDFSHKMIDAGADVVFGHGPHVTRAIEVYKDRFIAYSLGNFCTYGRFNISGPNGFAPIIRLKTDTFGKFVEADIVPVYQNAVGHVVYDERKRVITTIQKLVVADFPESLISITSNGKVTYTINDERIK